VIFIILLTLEIIVSYVSKILIEMYNQNREVYLGPGPSMPPAFADVIQDTFSFLLLYYYIIPMSLYVTIELNKFIGESFFTDLYIYAIERC
jgi:hypothetical protein